MTLPKIFPNIDAAKAAAEEAMKKKGVTWVSIPEWKPVDMNNSVGQYLGKGTIVDGRMRLIANANKSEFIGPYTDELEFWTRAYLTACDAPWEGSVAP
jgi:hypothetical protein